MNSLQQNKSPVFFVLLSLPSTAMGFALSVQIATLSWILSTQYQLDIHDIGLVWAAGPLAGIIGQVMIGLLSDRVWLWNGRRRPFILVGGVLSSLMLLALPNIGVISSQLGIGGVLGIAIAVALSMDLAINVSFNPARAIIADVTEPGRERTRGYTWMQTISGSFGVLAYAIGVIWDNFVLIYCGVGLALAFSIVPVLFIQEPRELPDQAPGPASQGQRDGLRAWLLAIRPLWAFLAYDIFAMARRLLGIEPAGFAAEIACAVASIALLLYTLREREGQGLSSFRKVLAAHAFSWIGIFTTFVFLVPYLQTALPELDDIHLGRVGAASFLVLNAVGALLPATVLNPAANRFGRVRVHCWAMGIMALGYVGLYFHAASASAIWLWMAVLGIGWGAMVSLPFAIVSQAVKQSQMGLYLGLFNLSVVLPQLVVSFGVALLLGAARDPSAMFALSAACLLVSALAWSRVPER